MILDMVWDRDDDRTYMFTASVDLSARSWMPEMGDEVRHFDGATRSVTTLKCQGEIRKEKKGFLPTEQRQDKQTHPTSVKQTPD